MKERVWLQLFMNRLKEGSVICIGGLCQSSWGVAKVEILCKNARRSTEQQWQQVQCRWVQVVPGGNIEGKCNKRGGWRKVQAGEIRQKGDHGCHAVSYSICCNAVQSGAARRGQASLQKRRGRHEVQEEGEVISSSPLPTTTKSSATISPTHSLIHKGKDAGWWVATSSCRGQEGTAVRRGGGRRWFASAGCWVLLRTRLLAGRKRQK